MYGLIGKIRTTPGQRDTVVEALLEGTRSMPGCLSYVVALDPGNADAIWVTEVWESREHHQASLDAPSILDHFRYGSKAVRGARGVGYHVMIGGVVLLFVHTHHHGNVLVLRRGRNHGLLNRAL